MALWSFASFADSSFNCEGASQMKANLMTIINTSTDQMIIELAEQNLASVRKTELDLCSLSGHELSDACEEFVDESIRAVARQYQNPNLAPESRAEMKKMISSMQETFLNKCGIN